MTCHDARELFSDWMDEALTAEDRAEVDAHLAGCADCGKELERLTATIALLHRMDRPRAPVGFVDRVLARTSPAPWHERFFKRLFVPLSVKLPAEVAAMLLVAGLAVHVFQQTPELQQAARQEAARPAARFEAPSGRSEAPSGLTAAPPPAPAFREAPGGTLSDRAASSDVQARRKALAAPEDARRSTSEATAKAAPPAPASPVAPSVEPPIELKKKAEERQRFAAPAPAAPTASTPRAAPADKAAKPPPPAKGGAKLAAPPPPTGDAAQPPAPPPAEGSAKLAVPPAPTGEAAQPTSPPAPAEGSARPAAAPPPATSGAVGEPGRERRLDANKEKQSQESGVAQAPAPAPPARGTTSAQGRADTESDKLLRSPAPRSAVRVLPSADIVGRLAVKDRDAAERSLGEALQRAGGVVISRREEPGTTVVEVAVPKAAYPEFSLALARIGTWRPEGEPSDLPPHVRVTLRLVQ